MHFDLLTYSEEAKEKKKRRVVCQHRLRKASKQASRYWKENHRRRVAESTPVGRTEMIITQRNKTKQKRKEEEEEEEEGRERGKPRRRRKKKYEENEKKKRQIFSLENQTTESGSVTSWEKHRERERERKSQTNKRVLTFWLLWRRAHGRCRSVWSRWKWRGGTLCDY